MRLKREKFYHYARVNIQYFTYTQNRIFFSSLRNMQLGDVGNQQKKNCEKMNEITTCCNKLVS